MSHFTKVATKINSLPALLKALARLGHTYDVGSDESPVNVIGYMHEVIKARIGVHFSGTQYGMGVVLSDDGVNFELAADWWGLETTLGKTEREIVDEIGAAYSLARVQIACEEGGWTFEEAPVVNADGSVELVAVQYGG